MAKVNKNSLRLDADFTEDTVGFALESFLALLSFPRYQFTIEPFSRGQERWLGADARLNGHLKGFKPFYMQFKRPSAYPDTSTAKVVTERTALNLTVSPRVLYFGLREKQPAHWDYQHNILHRLRRRLTARGIGDAAYVCPLFLDRSAYRFHIHMAGLRLWPRFWRYSPWELEDVLMSSGGAEFAFNNIPVLREHVSIPAHAIVGDAKHSYSFTEQGTDLCFHSPLALPEGANTLASFLANVIGKQQSDEPYIPLRSAGEEFDKLFNAGDEASDLPLIPPEFSDAEDGIEKWLKWGDYLKHQFQIEQFALIRWDE